MELKFADYIEEEIDRYKEQFPRLPVRAEVFEHIIYNCLFKVGFTDDDIRWKPGSHKTGGDLYVNDVHVQCKGGTLSNTKLIISGQRTTSFNTIEEKINFLSDKKEDVYLCLAKTKTHYKLLSFDSSVVDFGKSDEWVCTNAGWEYSRKGVQIKIVRNMSDQVWINIDTSVMDVEEILSMKM